MGLEPLPVIIDAAQLDAQLSAARGTRVRERD
jgi:hypothetical protein